jgi:hypothetical protein
MNQIERDGLQQQLDAANYAFRQVRQVHLPALSLYVLKKHLLALPDMLY